ncbi:GRP family sugar transporter [Kingella negevensis]|uniref:GRP family sugar transporter n=1 Tax=Kingella negevensis TaxID=1522312 RepID=UPI0006935E87|nr:GRP family sugar transporter [Kingella negevensis]MDK4688372.1 GRP family sugar transporter [Kingella negevensis]WII90367.1 GRP family sugar transporter [Kingella negevensis]
MDILIVLLPAIVWGSMILVTTYVGGTAYHQILGITVGALIFAVVKTLLFGGADWSVTTL